MLDNIKFIERKEFPNTIAVSFAGINIGKLTKGNNCWKLETLDVIPLFWISSVINSFENLEIAKEETIKYYNIRLKIYAEEKR